MPECYKCLQQNVKTNLSVEQLIAHFKFFHHLPSASSFLCLECLHNFQCLRAFKKHFKNNESCILTAETSKTNNTDFLKEAVDEILGAPSLETSFKNNISNNLCNLESVIEQIETSALLFVSHLHDKSNFARSDVEEIITGIINKLLHIMFSELKNFFYKKFNQEQTESKHFTRILDFCKNPFQNFTSFYKYIKTVEKKDCYKDPTIYYINNEINPVVSRANVQMNENKSKGMIMPLKF